jgi:hypothetical protein
MYSQHRLRKLPLPKFLRFLKVPIFLKPLKYLRNLGLLLFPRVPRFTRLQHK